MGGHGGLNILPQKRWNVYNYDNRERVRRDEEEAAKQEQLKREQTRKRDAEFRLQQLRTARGIPPLQTASTEPEPEPKQGHINLFEGIKIFDPIQDGSEKRKRGDDGEKSNKKKKEEREGGGAKVVTAEDEKCRMGYGVAGKGVKLPWYLERPRGDEDVNAASELRRVGEEKPKRTGKKTVEELRQERLGRERREQERERALVMDNKKTNAASASAFYDRKYCSSRNRTRR